MAKCTGRFEEWCGRCQSDYLRQETGRSRNGMAGGPRVPVYGGPRDESEAARQLREKEGLIREAGLRFLNDNKRFT